MEIDEVGHRNLVEIDATASIRAPVRIRGNENVLRIACGVKLAGLILEIQGHHCSIELGPDCNLIGALRCRADHAHIRIGAATTSMNATITLHEAGRISIGADCMLSGEVRMDVSDMHSILDRSTGTRINPARDISIGNHVWLAQGVTVAKGCSIGDGSVIGAKSLASGRIPANVVAAGVPAKVMRENIEWKRERL